MKWVKSFEHVSNLYVMKKYEDKIRQKLDKYGEFPFEGDILDDMLYLVIFVTTSENILKINKILNSLKKDFIRYNIYLSYDPNSYGGDDYKYRIYLKDLYSRRIKPPRYVYHSTKKESVNSILKNGLEPRSSTNHNLPAVEHPELIFASTGKDINVWNDVILQIDTKGLPNKWWEDLNFEDGSGYIFTNEPIPPSHIRKTNKLF